MKKRQENPVSEYQQILVNRSRFPPAKANALVPRQAALEEQILKTYGIGAFGGLLRHDNPFVVLEVALVILEKHEVSDSLRATALKRMTKLAEGMGTVSFSAHYYLKRKGLLDSTTWREK